jgi:hypothetical protein
MIEITGLKFPLSESIRVEEKNEVTYIYDSTGERRWEIYSFVMDWEQKQYNMLELQGRTRNGTWTTLIGMDLVKDVTSNKEIGTVVLIDVIDGPTDYHGDVSTPSIHMQYSTTKASKIYGGSYGGYYGVREDIEADLKKFRALGIIKDDLPREIDVHQTSLDILKTFMDGKFEPPPLVLKNTLSNNNLGRKLKHFIFPSSV